MEKIKFEFGLDKSEFWDNCVKIGRFDALFPKVDLNNLELDNKDAEPIPKYIELTLENKTHHLRSVMKDSRVGNIYVSPSTYSGEMLNRVTPKPSSSFKYWVYRMKYDKNLHFALLGLIIAILGLVIDGSFAIGKTGFIIWHLSEREGYLTG